MICHHHLSIVNVEGIRRAQMQFCLTIGLVLAKGGRGVKLPSTMGPVSIHCHRYPGEGNTQWDQHPSQLCHTCWRGGGSGGVLGGLGVQGVAKGATGGWGIRGELWGGGGT